MSSEQEISLCVVNSGTGLQGQRGCDGARARLRKGTNHMRSNGQTRALVAVGIATAAVLAGTQLAWADNVVNDIGATGSDTIAKGGSTVIGYKVNGAGSDGCNAADGTALTLTVNVPAAVTASVGSLSFSACNVVRSVTFTSNTVGDHAVTVSFSDAGGAGDYRNQANFILHVTGASNTAPSVAVAGVSHGATYEFGAVPAATCNATDTEDGPSSFGATVGALSGPRAGAGLGSQTASCSFTDTGGLTTTATATYSVVDTTGPVVQGPADATVEATSSAGAPVTFGAATAHDDVDGDIAASCSPMSGAVFPLGVTTVTCSATDAAGNPGATTFTVTVVDTTGPVVDAPTSVVAAAVSASGASVTFGSATAHDDVDGDIAASCSPSSGGVFPLGVTTATCSATDAAGNTGSDSFTVTVQDEDAPVVSPPADVTVEATSAAGASVAFGAATAHDNVDGDIAASCSPSSDGVFPLGVTTVTCSATDAAGNTGTNTFAVTARDTTAPAFVVPGDAEAEAASAAGSVVEYATPTASDAVDGVVAVNCGPASGTVFALGATTVSCSATDAAGNTRSWSFTVTVVDTTAPVVTPPADAVAEATSAAGAVVTYGSASALDTVDGVVAVGCSPASGSGFALGVTTVTCSATDAAGNTGTATFDVTVRDTTAPIVTVPANIATEAGSASGAVVVYSASADDVVDGAVAVDCSPASGSGFAMGTTTVVCTASDAADNVGGASFTVTVVDTTAPIVTVPATVVAEATSSAGAPAGYSGVSAHDVVDGAVAVDCSPPSGSGFALGTTTVTCTASDAAGNIGANGFDVTVVDTTAPALTVPGPQSATAASTAGAPVVFGTSALDVVDGPVTPSCDRPSGSTFPLGTTTVSCTARDGVGNEATRTFVVTVTYGWSNVLQPVNPDGTSVFKLGSTVPVKFRLTGASAGITDAVVRLLVTRLSGASGGTEAEAVSTAAATTGNTFRYDEAGNLYIFNLATKGLSDGVHQLRVDLGDGSGNIVTITLRK